MLSTSSGSQGSPAFSLNDREQLLNAKEVRLRQHELELLQQESRIAELCQLIISWRDQCAKVIEEAVKEHIYLPEIPVALQRMDKSAAGDDASSLRSSGPGSPPIAPVNQEAEELMFMIEESAKTKVNETEFALGASPNIPSPSSSPQSVPRLIESLTKPPEKVEEFSIEGTTPHVINIVPFTPQHQKTHRKSLSASGDIDEADLKPHKPNASQSDNEKAHSKIPAPSASDFDPQDLDQADSDSEIQLRGRSRENVRPVSMSVGLVCTSPAEIPRTQSSYDLSSIRKQEPLPSPETNTFPPDVVNLSKKVYGLGDILQPYRRLKYKMGATVEIPQTTTNILKNSFRFAHRLARSQPGGTPVVKLVPMRCLVILFDDLLCVCSERKIELRLPIVQVWLDTNVPADPKEGFVFLIITPEKIYKGTLSQEEKLLGMRRAWDETLKARLIAENKYLGDSKRLLAYEFESGQLYEGEWKSGVFCGKGNQRMPSGDYYEGYFVNGKRSGFGTLIKKSKQRYDGYWKCGQRCGKGTLYYSSKHPVATKFVGLWREDVRHGEGILYLKNGNFIRTTWNYGEPTFPAVLVFEDKRTRYIGDLNRSYECEGFGVCVYATDDRYYGQWACDDRHGKGYYVTAKGTEYNGNWAFDQMEGNGTLCFGNDESYITGKFSGDENTGVISVDGEFKFNRYDSQWRLSTLHGYKWHSFFSARLASHKKTDIEEVLNTSLLTTLSKGLSVDEGEVKQDLFNIYQCRKHPLGKLVFEFILVFKELYHKPEQQFYQLPAAVDDIRSFLNLLSDSFVSQFLKCDVTHDDCSLALQESLFPEISHILIHMYNITHEEKDNIADKKMEEIRTLPIESQMKVCGIEETYWQGIKEFVENDYDWNPTGETNAPFQTAVNALLSMSAQYTVQKKLECLKIAASMVENMLKKLMGQFGADEFLPLFCLVAVQSDANKLQSECAFIDDFIPDNLRFNVYGYLLTQMQIASGFFCSCTLPERV